MKAATSKYDVFSKVFVELSDESQDKLVKMAYHLSETHQLAKYETTKQEKPCRR
ncbi:MAG: hypothetical protein LBB81_05160 [Treponema sp.]|nr:hypothetical protein [Treponema sp.]